MLQGGRLKMTETLRAPESTEELRALILARYDTLSKRLQQIARHILDNPNEIALETLAVIAARCGVQPSAIVRFAKLFGFDGASRMQRLFRDELLMSNAALGYSDRIRQLDEAAALQIDRSAAQLLDEFVEGNVLALSNLPETISAEAMESAVALIADANIVYVAGARRSFPIAAYLSYSLLQAGKRTVFIDGVAGLGVQQALTVCADDLLIAVSYQPYANETLQIVEAVAERQAPILVISDSLVSPIAQIASRTLQVREAEVHKFRSLSASICLAQALVINFVFKRGQTSADVRI
jgi:DNA-binding MurR/RpiR family transcriptional regulator